MTLPFLRWSMPVDLHDDITLHRRRRKRRMMMMMKMMKKKKKK